jgi:transcriptional regulator with XRE-family HTH domain
LYRDFSASALTKAEILLSLLQKYRLSQRKLAEKSGVNYVTINRLLNDYQFVSLRPHSIDRKPDARRIAARAPFSRLQYGFYLRS